MRVTLKRAEFQRALSKAVGAMSSRSDESGKPVGMKATPCGVVLTAQDPGVWISVRVAEDAVLYHDPGSLVMPGRALLELVRASEEDSVDVAEERGRVMVRIGTSTAWFPSREMYEIREAAGKNGGATVRVSAADLKQGLRAVVSAAAKPPIPVLSGVHLRVGGEGLVALTSDKTRAARSVIPCEGAFIEAEVTLPVTTVATLLRTLGAAEGPVDVEIGPGGVLARTEEWTGFVHGVEVRYPVEKVTWALDVSRSAVAEVDARRLHVALCRIAAVATRDLSAVEIELGDPVRLTSKTDIMRVEEVIEPVRFEGVSVRMGLNVLHLREMVQAKGDATLRLWVSDEGVAGVTTGAAEYAMAPMVTRWPRKTPFSASTTSDLVTAVR